MLPINERKIIIENLKMVHKVILWDDHDKSACGAISFLLSILNKNEKLVFANGGDRKKITFQKLKNLKKIKI